MDRNLKSKIEKFVEANIVSFHEARASNLSRLRLAALLKRKNPYLFKAKHIESAPDLIHALLAARLSSSEEGFFGMFMEALAVYVAQETSGGSKSATTGIDIELTRDNCRYLIAVKSGTYWGNSSQRSALKRSFATAVKVLKQNKHTGAVQPTLGICYGNFKEVNNGEFLHIGGQGFWQLLSGEADFYTQIIEPLGHRAKEYNEVFEFEKARIYNRMTGEFIADFCVASGEIDWKKLVAFVSKNLT